MKHFFKICLLALLMLACSKSEKVDKNVTVINYWTFQELHVALFEAMAIEWNTLHPDKLIKVVPSILPYDDMHNKLLIALQSGKGAPDIVDIEINKYTNFLKGDIGLLPLNDVIEPELKNIVASRADIYKHDGKYYGIDYHVGATVTYYNKEILDKAGINPANIKTWADYHEAGKQVLAKTGIPMTGIETTDKFSIWAMMAQRYTDPVNPKTGAVNVNSKEMQEITGYWQTMLNDGTAVTVPGGFYHSEEFFGFMNSGAIASLTMPLWYMGRLVDYMPDLKGKIIIEPMPVWDSASAKSVGIGGTGTAVTKYTKNPEVVKEFLGFAKLSEKGNIETWQRLGFDPIRTSVWSLPVVKEPNKFTQYFANNPFDVLNSLGSDFPSAGAYEKTPAVIDKLNTVVFFEIYENRKPVKEVLDAVQAELEQELGK